MNLQEVIAFAMKAHEGQFRRDGVTPYIVHPIMVMVNVEGGDKERMVAVLHDVLEDTDFIADDLLYHNIDTEVVEAVEILTKTKGQSYEDYLVGVRENDLARVVKISDMHSNLNDTPTERQIEKYTKGLEFLQSND